MSSLPELVPDLYEDLRSCSKFSKRLPDTLLLEFISKVLSLRLTGNPIHDEMYIKGIQNIMIMDWYDRNVKVEYVSNNIATRFDQLKDATLRQYNGEIPERFMQVLQRSIFERKKNSRTKKESDND
jgi:hypothetical protein